MERRARSQRAYQPAWQAEEEEHGGGIDKQGMLHHVGAQEESFSGLIERRTDRQIEEDEGTVEFERMAARIIGAGGEFVTQGTGQHGIEPSQEDESADEVGLVMPMAPVDHGTL